MVWAKVEKTATGGFKPRPVLVVASWPFDGSFDYLVMLCTSSGQVDPHKFEFSNSDFDSGGFEPGEDEGFIRPSYLTNVREVDFEEKVGSLKPEVVERAMRVLRSVLN